MVIVHSYVNVYQAGYTDLHHGRSFSVMLGYNGIEFDVVVCLRLLCQMARESRWFTLYTYMVLWIAMLDYQRDPESTTGNRFCFLWLVKNIKNPFSGTMWDRLGMVHSFHSHRSRYSWLTL